MKKVLLNFLILSLSFAAFSQDIDFYHKFKNENFNYPPVDWNMSLNEYQILSRNLRMQDMIFALGIPGYVHFYAKDYYMGTALLISRLAAYGTIYITFKNMLKYNQNLTLYQALKYSKVAHMYIGSPLLNFFPQIWYSVFA